MKSGDTLQLQTLHNYDENNRLVDQFWKLSGGTYREQFNYDTNGRLTYKQITLPNNVTRVLTQSYDTLSRVSSIGSPATTTIFNYADAANGSGTTGKVYQMSVTSTQNGNDVFGQLYYRYAYDALGNIAHIENVNQNTVTYYGYDDQSQLLYESDTVDGTRHYTYDQAGNLYAKDLVRNNQTLESFTYTYGNTTWRDTLTALSVTRNGTTTNGSYSYDASGNPTSYFNPKDLATWTMTWRNGRELATASKTGTSVSYEYDVNALRTKKTVGGVTHNYVYAGGQLLRESYTENGNSYVLDFVYDQNGRPFMLCLTQNGGSVAYYYYILNLQGDVIYLADYAGTAVATYDYDAWGNIRSQSGWLANRNPLRYRGYYYDEETGFYYLQSRYYDPALGRFINADCYASTGTGFLGCNMFAYCNNNPVSYKDVCGDEPIEAIDIDGDGTTDCYVYEYSYESEEILIGGGWRIKRTISGEGRIYIYPNCTSEQTPSGFNNATDIIVADNRDHNDGNPNIVVFSSYKIQNKAQQEAIIDTLLQYDKEYPKKDEYKWGRTKKSLCFEWQIHNFAAQFGYKRAYDTDFDKNEEGYTLLDYIKKWLK